MPSLQVVILLIVFFAVLATAYIVINAMVPGAAQKRLQKVLGGKLEVEGGEEQEPLWVQKVVSLAGPLSKLQHSLLPLNIANDRRKAENLLAKYGLL